MKLLLYTVTAVTLSLSSYAMHKEDNLTVLSIQINKLSEQSKAPALTLEQLYDNFAQGFIQEATNNPRFPQFKSDNLQSMAKQYWSILADPLIAPSYKVTLRLEAITRLNIAQALKHYNFPTQVKYSITQKIIDALISKYGTKAR